MECPLKWPFTRPVRLSVSAANPPAAQLISSQRANQILWPGFEAAARPLSRNLPQAVTHGAAVGGNQTNYTYLKDLTLSFFREGGTAKLPGQQQEAVEPVENRKMKSRDVCLVWTGRESGLRGA